MLDSKAYGKCRMRTDRVSMFAQEDRRRRVALELRSLSTVQSNSSRRYETLQLLEGGRTEDQRTAANQPRPRHERPTFAVPALILLAVCLGTFLTAISLRDKEAAISAWPPEARSQLLQHGLTELRTTCREPYAVEGILRDHCIEEARLMLALPECGATCRTDASATLPHGRR
jgi:hypothetical protein